MIAEPVLANSVDSGNSSFDFVLADTEEAHHNRHSLLVVARNSQVAHLEGKLAAVQNLEEAGFAIAAEAPFHQDIRSNNSAELLEQFALAGASIVHFEEEAEKSIAEAARPVAVGLATAREEHSDTVAAEAGREQVAADSVVRSILYFLPKQKWASRSIRSRKKRKEESI